MKHFALLVLWTLIGLFSVTPRIYGAESPEDRAINQLLAELDRASEKGDFSKVQLLRMRTADFAVSVGRYELAVRLYEVLLAARPRKADRVRYNIRLGNTCMAMKDYSRAIVAYDNALHDSPKDWEANLQRARA